MSTSIPFLSKPIPGYGPHDVGCLPCSGVPGRAMCISQYSPPYDYKFVSDIKLLPLRCASRHTSYVCNATPNNYRRNSDKQGFSRNRNRHNEDRESYDDFEESDSLSSKNGSVSYSGNQKLHATSAPGPREKEIVDIFRKVQAKLREKGGKKEVRKVESSQVKSKENETVDSLLKLLRRHSVQQGKKNTNGADDKDFILDQPEQVSFKKETRPSIPVPDNSLKPEITEIPTPHRGRPKSNFQKRSPVPEVKFQPILTKGPINSVTQESLDVERKGNRLETESDSLLKLDIDSDSESDSDSPEPGVDVFDELLEDEPSDDEDEDEDEDHDDEEETPSEVLNLNGMKLTELKALAKSRGMKGYSKLKKDELIDILSGSST